MASKNQNGGSDMGAYAAEDDVSRKRIRKENGVSTFFQIIKFFLLQKVDINEAVETAKRLIIQTRYEEANRLVYDKMTDMIKNKIFGENSIELLPAYFVLADANIHMGH